MFFTVSVYAATKNRYWIHRPSGIYAWKVTKCYTEGRSFTVDYSVDTIDASLDGPVPLPDIVICLEAPWDVEKSMVLNMSINLLSYMTNLAFPFGGFGTSIYDYDSGDWNNTLIHE